MTSRLSEADRNNELDVRFGRAASTAPTTYYLGLSLTEPASDGTGVTEPTATAYGRVAVPNDATNWPAAVDQIKSNALTLTFPTPGATPGTHDWGTLPYWVLYDHATSTLPSHYRAGGELDEPVVVLGGDSAPYFDPGKFVITAPAG